MDELTKIDQIRQRTDATFKQAKEALDWAEGDVVKAIIHLEEQQDSWNENMHVSGSKVFGQMREIFQKGNVTKVRLKKGEETVIEVPASIGALGIIGALASTELAIIAGIGTVAALANKYKLEIVRPDGTTEEHPLAEYAGAEATE